MNDATCVPLDGTESESGSESDLNLVFAYECMCPSTHTGEFCEEKGIHKCRICRILAWFDETLRFLSLFKENYIVFCCCLTRFVVICRCLTRFLAI